MDPLVSVLVPTFNRRNLLERALGSILMQSYRQLEVVVSDNHSTDDTAAMVADFARRDSRVRYQTSPVGNTSAMLNIRSALDAASGKYAVVLADDDFFLDFRYIAAGVDILRSRRLGLLTPDCVLGRTPRQVTSLDMAPVTSGREFFLNFWRKNYHIPVISNLFEIAIARQCDPWTEPDVLYADVELWLKMMTLTDVGYYDCPAVYYHFHGRNIVSTISLEMHKKNVRFIGNAAKFAEPVLGAAAILEWKKTMLVEYLQLVLRENCRPSYRDFLEMRSVLELDGHSLGWRRWLRIVQYVQRQTCRSVTHLWRRPQFGPRVGDKVPQPAGF